MLDIQIKTIADSQQRYNTTGDYFTDENSKMHIYVSDLGDWRYELLIAVHELIESSLCRHRGIPDSLIDEFDMEYENNRSTTDLQSEPGDDQSAPYYKEHQFATKLERMIASELNVDWSEYSRVCAEMTKEDKNG